MFTRRYTNFWDGLFRPSKTHILGSGVVKVLTNLVANGNFVNTTGWSSYVSNNSASSNTLTNTATGVDRFPSLSQALAAPTIGRKYALTVRVRVTNSNATSISYRYGLAASVVLQASPVANTWYQKTIIITCDNTYATLAIYHIYATNAAANGKVMEVQYVSCVDLTAAFGAGNEPTQEEYAAWINTQSNSWFDTTAQYLCNTNQWF